METTAYYKGHKSRSETGGEITLTDYDAGMTYTIDTENKTYSVAQIKPAQRDTTSALPGNKSFVHSGGQTQTIAGYPATNTKFMSVTQIVIGAPAGASAPMLPPLTISGEEWMADGLLPEDARNAGFAEFSKLVPLPQLPGAGGFAQKMLAVKGFPLATTLQIRIAFPAGAGPALVNALPRDPITLTMRAKSVATAPLDDALFALPEGFQKVDALPAPNAAPRPSRPTRPTKANQP